MRGIVFDEGKLEVVVVARAARPAARRGAGRDQGRRRVPQRPERASTAPSRSRRRSCSATRAPASSPRSASAVTGVQVGDHVVLSTLGNCGACAACDAGKPTHCRTSIGKLSAPFTLDGDARRSSSPTSARSAEFTIVKARQAVPIDKDVPFEVASLHRLRRHHRRRRRVQPGQGHPRPVASLVIGVGGIGLNVIQGAAPRPTRCRSSPSTPTRRRRRWPSSSAPPTSSTRAEVDAIEAIKEICPNGVDFSFECVGHPALIRQSIDMLDWGGTVRDPRRAQVRHRGRLTSCRACTTTRRSWAAATAPAVRTRTSR